MKQLKIIADPQIRYGFVFVKFILDPSLMTSENVRKFTSIQDNIITRFHYFGEDGVEIRVPLKVIEMYGPKGASHSRILYQMGQVANSIGASFNPSMLDRVASDMEGIMKSVNALDDFKNDTDDILLDKITNLLRAKKHDVTKSSIQAFLNDEANAIFYGKTGEKLQPIKLSERNKLLAYYQWILAGRQGYPTYLLTQMQWRLYGKMRVNTNKKKVTPIILMRGDNPAYRTRTELQQIANLTPQETKNLNMVNVENLYHKVDFEGSINEFYPEPFFDISDMKREDATDKTFAQQPGMTNVQGNPNAKLQSIDIGTAQPNAAMKRKNFISYVSQNPSPYLDSQLETIKRGDKTPVRLAVPTLGVVIAKQILQTYGVNNANIEKYGPICYDIAMKQTRVNNDELVDVPDEDKDAMFETMKKLVRISNGLFESKEKEKILESFNDIFKRIEKVDKILKTNKIID